MCLRVQNREDSVHVHAMMQFLIPGRTRTQLIHGLESHLPFLPNSMRPLFIRKTWDLLKFPNFFYCSSKNRSRPTKLNLMLMAIAQIERHEFEKTRVGSFFCLPFFVYRYTQQTARMNTQTHTRTQNR